jgi:hypothetical protein
VDSLKLLINNYKSQGLFELTNEKVYARITFLTDKIRNVPVYSGFSVTYTVYWVEGKAWNIHLIKTSSKQNRIKVKLP